MGQPQQQQPQMGQPGRPAVLNQLYPTDLLTQPFNVTELDLPPPPIILPPNVSENVHFTSTRDFC
jgi:protein transport protein SEC24